MAISNAGIVGRLLDVGGTVYNVQHPDYGVTASTSVDQRTRIQSALDDIADAGGGVAYFPPGSYLVNNSLHVYGSVSMLGVYGCSNIIVNGYSTRTNNNFIGCGANSTNGNELWTGSIRNMRFVPGPDLGVQVGRLINVFNAENYDISFNKFDGFDDDVTAIKGGSDSEWHTVSGSVRKRGLYFANIIEMAQSGTGAEQISVSAVQTTSYAEDIWIIQNYTAGGGDDPIALHGVTGGLVENNTALSYDGRILIANSERIRVLGNYCEHTSTGGGAAHIWVAPSNDGGDTRLCRDIVVANNECWIKPGQSVANCIRISGCNDVLVEGNKILNEGHTAANISVEARTVTNLDYLAGRVTVRNNHLIGGRIRAVNAQRNDWVKFGPNTVDGAGIVNTGLYQKTDHFDGDEIHAHGISNIRMDVAVGSTAANDGPLDVEEDIVDAQLLGIWESTALSTGGNTTLTLGRGLHAHVKLDDGLGFVPTKVIYNTSAVPSAGSTAQIEILDDGTVLARVTMSTAGSTSGNVKWNNDTISATEPLGNCGGASPGSAMGVRVNDASTGYLNGATIRAEIWGIRVQAVPDNVGDASVTLSASTSQYVTRFATTLTNNRTVTLPDSSNTPSGTRFRVISHSTGAFTITISSTAGTVSTIASATPTVVTVQHSTGGWALSEASTLA